MKDYIERLVRCGYTQKKAREICQDFSKNLPAFDLDLFVRCVEEHFAKRHVAKV